MSNDFSFTTSCDLDVKNFEENFLKSKKYKMRIAMNDSEEYIRELCREENSELVLDGKK